jgi:bifunctional non-homologous end joining protein LigD
MNTINQAALFFKEGSSDKEYHLQLVETNGEYVVNFQYGRRGSALKAGSKTATPVPLEDAQKIYDKLLAEKLGKGYQPGEGHKGNYVSTNPPATASETKEIFFVPQLLNPIDESEIESYLRDDNFGAQEKLDGQHQAFSKKAGKVQVTNKKGQAIGYPEALKDAIQTDKDVLVDSEAIGETFYAFDILEANGEDLRGLGFGKRYKVLKAFAQTLNPETIKLVPLAIGYAEKKALYDKLKAECKEGIVFKKLDSVYNPGRPFSGGPFIKCKFYGELSARVRQGREGKRSIGLELIDSNGVWIDFGNCTIPSNKEKPKIGSVVEIKYLYALKGGSLYQPLYKEQRTDVYPEECTVNQVKYKPE